MANVIVVGSVNVDVIVSVPRLPIPGETLLGGDPVWRPGGKGANQAVAAARLGAATRLFGATGADALGAEVRSALSAEAVDLSHLDAVEGAPTGVALVVVDSAGENMITVAPGANHRFAPDLRDLSAALNGGDVLLLQLEIPLSVGVAATEAAVERGARVIVNAAPLPPLPDPRFERMLAGADVLVVNETEALGLGGSAKAEAVGDWQAVAKALCERGPSACVVTLGEWGAVFAADGRARRWPAFAVPVVDTTGAGDAFCGALAAATAQGQSLTEAVRVGCAAGALATTQVGAQSALPTRSDVDRLLAAAPPSDGG